MSQSHKKQLKLIINFSIGVVFVLILIISLGWLLVQLFQPPIPSVFCPNYYIQSPVTLEAIYTNKSKGFQIKYPKSWVKDEVNDPITHELVRFHNTAESNSNCYVQITIKVDYPKRAYTRQKYMNDFTIKPIKRYFKSYTFEQKTTNAKLSGYDAYQVIYSGINNQGIAKKVIERGLLTGEGSFRVYVIFFETNMDVFYDFEPVAEAIIQEFKVLTKK